MPTEILLCCLSSCSNGGLCQCGSTRDSHASVTLNDYFSTAIVSHWESSLHTSESPTDAYGEVAFAGASKKLSYVGKHFPAQIRRKELFKAPQILLYKKLNPIYLGIRMYFFEARTDSCDK